MTGIFGAEYLLDGYLPLGRAEIFEQNGLRYYVQRFQGKHMNEYLVKYQNGDVFLFENNVLKQQWQENENGQRSNEFIAYKNGRVDFSQRYQDILEQVDHKRFVYHRKGRRMEIWSVKTGHLLYHGRYNSLGEKEGWGIEYDKESGNVVFEGIWSRGELMEVIRCFNGDTMTELKRNGSDSLDPVKRIPIYVGGFRYDEDNETFIREGKGCLISAKGGIATRESEWKDGKEVSGVNLNEGCYTSASESVSPTTTVYESDTKPSIIPDTRPEPVSAGPVATIPKSETAYRSRKVTIRKSEELMNLSLQVTELTISSNCCNDANAFNLNGFECLRSIEIGDDCFGSVQTFQIDGLNRLKTIKIGKNSCTTMKSTDKWDRDGANNPSKSFRILNCESLESIEIAQYSFSDFGGAFELKNLSSLYSIKIGELKSKSFNFYWSSFVVRGIDVILKC